jgi:nucleotide-binding universal stress UspA family protein
VLVVPDDPSPLQHPLLAYDGTPKAREALFVATYIAGRWDLPLTVLSVVEGDRVNADVLAEAQDYLKKHGVDADCREVQRDDKRSVADTILTTVAERDCDLILMGGYGMGPMVEAVLGSTVDEVLRKTTRPLLICR